MSSTSTKLIMSFSGRQLAALLTFAIFISPAAVRAQAPVPPQEPAAPNPNVAAPAAVEPAAAAGDAMQVLEEGPIHEAFAEPVALDVQPRVVVDRQPPEPINELPPDVRPEGANVQWIPGYWMFSDEMKDFIWVSGVWRDVPPGRRWVPGHWADENGSFQWVGGFWADEQVQEVQMLPNPPDTLEVGPSSPAPAANYFWVPGCWIYGNSGYSWRTGYWYAGQQNWLWVPDHYSYTPYGSIFVSGYWDYQLPYRGLLYAPVYWSRPVWNTAGWYYRPRSVVNTALLLTSLFVNGGYNHYYYGYGNWRNNSFHPWWDHGHRGHGGHRHYDPVYAYHRWHDGKNRDDWANDYRRDFEQRRRDVDGDRRPGDRPGAGRPSREQLVTNAEDWARQRGRSGGLRQLSDAERQATMRQLKTSTDLREARMKAELDRRRSPTDGRSPADARAQTGNRAPADNRAQAGNRGPGERSPERGPRDQASRQAAIEAARRGETGTNRSRPQGADAETLARARANRSADAATGQSRSAFKLPPAERTTTRGRVAGSVGQTPQAQGSQRTLSRQEWQNRASGRIVTPGQSRQATPGSSVQSPAQRAWSGSRGGEGSPSSRSIPSGSLQRGPTRSSETPATRRGGSSSFRGAPSGTPSTRSSAPSPSFRGTPSSGSPSFRSSPSSGSPSFRGSPSTSSRSYRSTPSGGSPSFRSSSGSPSPSARSYSGSRGPSPSFQSRGGGGPSRSFSSGSSGGGRPSSSFSRGGGGGGGERGGGGGGGRGRR